MDNNTLTVKDYADSIHVHPNTVHRMIKDDRLPGATKAGKAWLIPVGTLPLGTPPKDLSSPPQQAVDSKAKSKQGDSLKELSDLVNSGNATPEQIGVFVQQVKNLQSIGAIAIVSGLVIPLDELKRRETALLDIATKLKELDEKQKQVASDQEDIDSQWLALKESKMQQHETEEAWSNTVKSIHEDLITIKCYYTGVSEQIPEAEKILLPQLNLKRLYNLDDKMADRDSNTDDQMRSDIDEWPDDDKDDFSKSQSVRKKRTPKALPA